MTKVAVFAYNFPHKKTQDFLTRLLIEGFDAAVVVACDPLPLNIPAATVRVKPRHADLIPPQVICDRFGIPYVVTPHNSPECVAALEASGADVAVIAGARILKGDVIRTMRKGIINFHPGILPWVRGLDALQWALYDHHPVGVTAHVIDERVDGGRILLRQEIPIHGDDSLIDLSLRLYEMQLNMIAPAVLKLLSSDLGDLEQVAGTKPYRKMPPQLEAQLSAILDARKSSPVQATVQA